MWVNFRPSLYRKWIELNSIELNSIELNSIELNSIELNLPVGRVWRGWSSARAVWDPWRRDCDWWRSRTWACAVGGVWTTSSTSSSSALRPLHRHRRRRRLRRRRRRRRRSPTFPRRPVGLRSCNRLHVPRLIEFIIINYWFN